MITKKALLAVLAAVAVPAAAIELSLEENKAERGSIGYIDMQRLFKTFPETARAKESFEELVRQAEEQLNLRKAEILRLRGELTQLKAEREFLAKMPIETPKAPPKLSGPTAAEKAAAEKAAAEKAAAEKAAAAAKAAKEAKAKQDAELKRLLEQKAPPPQVADVNAKPSREQEEPAMPAAGRRQQEPETDLTRPSIANLPGFGSEGGAADMTPDQQRAQQAQIAAEEAAAKAAQATQPNPQDENAREAAEQAAKAAEARKQQEQLIVNIPGVSTAPIVVQAPEAPPLPAAAPEAPSSPAVAVATAPAAAPVNPALVELDAKIAVKTKELAAKELEYKTEQASSEKNLLELESRRTEMLLGKIHRAVQEIARKEGVSVVVDKSSILFGHDAVDLTEKVMKHLKGT